MTTTVRNPLQPASDIMHGEKGERPKIMIIYTGGTIGMIENPVTRTLEPFNFDHLLENVPIIN